MNKGKENLYSDSLRTFATTLNFYSAKAYEYVRQKFNNALPHPRSIRRWYQSVTPNGIIKWNYIEKLNECQNKTGLRLAPNLTNKHVHFENSKMKVLLAVQVISGSVAKALHQMRELNDEFEGCEATVEFLNLFNDLFDLFNSTMQDDNGFKKPLTKDNFDLYIEPLK